MKLPNGKSAFCVIVLILVCVLAAACTIPNTPEVAWQRFQSKKDVPEENLMDPLIVAGKPVVPLVLEKIQDKRLPRRRYAISFLGNGAYQEALSALEGILQDESEEDIFRGDALESICQIDYPTCASQAEKYKTMKDYLGNIAGQVLAGEDFSDKRRSYLAAWLAEF